MPGAPPCAFMCYGQLSSTLLIAPWEPEDFPSKGRLAVTIQYIPAVALLQVSWWYLVPADAVELVRVSAVKTVKALQTVARFFTQVCTDIARHRYEASQICSWNHPSVRDIS